MKKILLIEDTEDVRESTAEILELANYEIETAENGVTGVEKVNEFKPDLIICDIMMPDLDGYGVLHILSKKPETASIPFIFLTAKSERSDMRRGMIQGADDYLTKPFEEVELLDAIESRFKKNELLKEVFTKDLKGLNEFYDKARGSEGLKDLSKNRNLKSYKSKSYIYTESTPAFMAYFIQSGKVKTCKTNENGKEFVTGIHDQGEFIGYMSLIGESQEYSESAVVLEDAEICAIPKEDFNRFLFASKSVSEQFIKMLSRNVQDREQQLMQIAYNSVRQRIARKLIELYDRFQPENEDLSPVMIQITREDLAGMVGTAKETLIRTMSDFRQEGLIASEKKGITILDKDQLERISAWGHL